MIGAQPPALAPVEELGKQGNRPVGGIGAINQRRVQLHHVDPVDIQDPASPQGWEDVKISDTAVLCCRPGLAPRRHMFCKELIQDLCHRAARGLTPQFRGWVTAHGRLSKDSSRLDASLLWRQLAEHPDGHPPCRARLPNPVLRHEDLATLGRHFQAKSPKFAVPQELIARTRLGGFYGLSGDFKRHLKCPDGGRPECFQ